MIKDVIFRVHTKPPRTPFPESNSGKLGFGPITRNLKLIRSGRRATMILQRRNDNWQYGEATAPKNSLTSGHGRVAAWLALPQRARNAALIPCKTESMTGRVLAVDVPKHKVTIEAMRLPPVMAPFRRSPARPFAVQPHHRLGVLPLGSP